ncbi:uncharacterized protein F4807DRAFT_463675 [Annulohypoxylon truncatum]|uniref:uncharacterized protein n=1 Tax=Annulohypoxylon truncatum TaxID=327061 RepID=UPI0020083DD6|nr:uncharacterized protein F4807DRAFT_463675 [Annulohypoxylon truncatum]KAI1206466.1 hypothetical protein F4807DRAFT_463675 [Annulohypoxylon truncatum]
MRHQITILAVVGLVPSALGQSSSATSMDMSMDMSMSMDMPMSMSMDMSMPMSTSTPTPTPTTTLPSIPCLAPGAALLGPSLPKPSNSALALFIANATNLNPQNAAQLATDPCGAATSLVSSLPSSLHSAAASYQTQLSSYVSANAQNISSLYAECKSLTTATTGTVTVSGERFAPAGITGLVGLVTAFADTGCVKGLAAAATGEPTGTATATTTATEGGGQGSKNVAEVARPTGVVGAAVAAVGFMGAVALL